MEEINIYELLRGLESPDAEFEWSSNNGVIGIARVTPEEKKIQGAYYRYPPEGTLVYTFSGYPGLRGRVAGTEEDLITLIGAYQEKHGRPITLRARHGIYTSLFVPFSNCEEESRFAGTLEQLKTELDL